MKILYFLSIVMFCFSCTDRHSSPNNQEESVIENEFIVPEFQIILDSASVNGSIVIYDLKEDKYFSNDFTWAKSGHLPASTFKIANSIIAIETGIVENDSTLFKWNGEKRALKLWEQDLILKEAFHYSCVPCYQEIARKIGVKRMSEYLNKLEYGTMIVDSTSIDLFWLEGKSRIDQFEQIDFLKQFYQSQLPISDRTVRLMKRMMVIEDDSNYTLSGKTGWSISNGKNNGWFVGYVQTLDNTYFFASNIEPKKEFEMNVFPAIRKEITFNALKQMEIIK